MTPLIHVLVFSDLNSITTIVSVGAGVLKTISIALTDHNKWVVGEWICYLSIDSMY
jgi:hypothetical protein